MFLGSWSLHPSSESSTTSLQFLLPHPLLSVSWFLTPQKEPCICTGPTGIVEHHLCISRSLFKSAKSPVARKGTCPHVPGMRTRTSLGDIILLATSVYSDFLLSFISRGAHLMTQSLYREKPHWIPYTFHTLNTWHYFATFLSHVTDLFISQNCWYHLPLSIQQHSFIAQFQYLECALFLLQPPWQLWCHGNSHTHTLSLRSLFMVCEAQVVLNT